MKDFVGNLLSPGDDIVFLNITGYHGTKAKLSKGKVVRVCTTMVYIELEDYSITSRKAENCVKYFKETDK